MSVPGARRRRRAAFAVLGLLAAGCGIGVDRSPRVVEKNQQRDLGATRQPDATGLQANGEQRIFFVTDLGKTGGSRLQQVSRQVANTPAQVLAALFKGPTDAELNSKLRTAIPAAAVVLAPASTSGDLVTVNLDATLASTGGDRQILAIAQIVYTLTSIDGVNRVRILIDGVPREWPTEDGTPRSEPLTRFAYAELDPSTQPELPPVPSPTSPSTTTPAAATTAPAATTSAPVGADPAKN